MKTWSRADLIRETEREDVPDSYVAQILAERQALALEGIQDQLGRWAIGEYAQPDEKPGLRAGARVFHVEESEAHVIVTDGSIVLTVGYGRLEGSRPRSVKHAARLADLLNRYWGE